MIETLLRHFGYARAGKVRHHPDKIVAGLTDPAPPNELCGGCGCALTAKEIAECEGEKCPRFLRTL